MSPKSVSPKSHSQLVWKIRAIGGLVYIPIITHINTYKSIYSLGNTVYICFRPQCSYVMSKIYILAMGNTYIHTYMHTYTHTYIHTRTHARKYEICCKFYVVN